MPGVPPTASRRPLVQRALRWVLLAGIVCVVFGYRYSAHRWCSHCWASMRVGEVGLALTTDHRLPVFRNVERAGETHPSIARFMPPGHVHDAGRSGIGASMDGPYVLQSTRWCLGPMPSEFATALMQQAGFADHVARRVAAGTLDVETVRSLIAVPDERRRDDWRASAEHAALLRTGTEVYAEFTHAAPEATEFWREDRNRPAAR